MHPCREAGWLWQATPEHMRPTSCRRSYNNTRSQSRVKTVPKKTATYSPQEPNRTRRSRPDRSPPGRWFAASAAPPYSCSSWPMSWDPPLRATTTNGYLSADVSTGVADRPDGRLVRGSLRALPGGRHRRPALLHARNCRLFTARPLLSGLRLPLLRRPAKSRRFAQILLPTGQGSRGRRFHRRSCLPLRARIAARGASARYPQGARG